MLAAGGVAAYYIFTQLDNRIAREIETYASRALGTAVEVGSVVTDLRAGSATVAGLSVANPQGYENDHALQLGSFSASVDYASREIEQVIIDQPVVNAELIAGKLNFQQLLDNLPSEDQVANSNSDAGPNITVKRFMMKNALVNFSSDNSKIGDRQFPIADMVAKNLSGSAEQITQQLSRRLTDHLLRQIKSNAGDLLRARAEQELKEEVESLGDRLRDKLREELSNDDDVVE